MLKSVSDHGFMDSAYNEIQSAVLPTEAMLERRSAENLVNLRFNLRFVSVCVFGSDVLKWNLICSGDG